MADDETPKDETKEPKDEAPAEEAPAEETPAEGASAEEAPAEETSDEEPAEASDEVADAADEPADSQAPPPAGNGGEAEASGGDVQEDVGGVVPEASGGDVHEDVGGDIPEKPEADESAEKPKAKDAPPGAELDPIALEPDRPLSAEERARAEAEAEEREQREAEATADVGEEEPVAAKPAVELPADALIQATGKRKSAIARVVLRAGKGSFEINSRTLEEYFPRHQHQAFARQPLVTAGYEEAVDVRVRVRGGGIAGQAGAVRHGVARALTEVDPELRGELKRRGLLTRDARRKERRKAGLKKARKRPQFSKR